MLRVPRTGLEGEQELQADTALCSMPNVIMGDAVCSVEGEEDSSR